MTIELTNKGAERAVEIMQMIDQVRAEHDACTAREVSRLLCTAHTIIAGRMQALRSYGLVAWTGLNGSVRITDEGRAWLEAQLSQRDESQEPQAPAKKAVAKKAAPAKKAAAKK